MDHQLIVIGAGPGGYEAALRAAELGIDTAIIEKRDVGGTCLNRGCVPTKTLLHAARLAQAPQEGADFGVELSQPKVDAERLFAKKRDVSTTLRQGVEGLLESAGVVILRGTGAILGSGRVRFTDGKEVRELTCQHILIATGCVPARPPIPGLELEGVLTSDDLLDGKGVIFDSLVIIGGGVIGVELASFYSAMGTQVTIVEGLDRLLPNMDREIGQNLAANLKKRGVQIFTKAMVKEVQNQGDGLGVCFLQREKEKVAQGQRVLCAIGRRPDLSQLLSEGVSLELNGRQIKVDQNFQTSLPGVYAIGDVSSPIQLAHAASAQGRSCVEHLAGRTQGTELSVVPGCVYTDPEIACVGMTLDQAKEAGIDAVSGKYVMFSNARTMILNAPRSFLKVVVEKETHRILGAQMMCPNATDMITQFTSAIVNRLTVEQLLLAIRPHPTFEEGVGEALRSALSKLG